MNFKPVSAHMVRRVTLVWLLLLVIGSMQPARPGSIVALHREIHWLAFGGLTLLLLLLSRTRQREIACVIATCLLGLALECVQHFIYRKSMEWRDVRDDTLAALLALAAYRLITFGWRACAAGRRDRVRDEE